MLRRIMEAGLITFIFACGSDELFSITLEETAQTTIITMERICKQWSLLHFKISEIN